MSGLLKRSGRLAILVWEAQGKVCPLCDRPLIWARTLEHPDYGWSIEHVWPRRYGYGQVGNMLISHVSCNNRKGSRDPTGCELLILEAVNARLGFKLRPLPHQNTQTLRSYLDQIAGPSALSLAFQRGPPDRGQL
jgi:hypothetical protein